MNESAGQRLRADLDKALAAAARQQGEALEFDEREQIVISMAAAAADRVEQLRAVWEVLIVGKVSATALANLAGELRMHERAVIDLCGRVALGTGAAKSPRHQRAAQARWNRQPAVR